MRGSIDDGARDRGALLLAAGQRDPALADHRVVAFGKSATSLSSRATAAAATMRSHAVSGSSTSAHLPCLPAPACELLRVQAERDVVGQRVGEQERLLRHEADGAAQDAEREVAHVDAVDEHRARRRIVQPREQDDQRRLARAGDADERDRLPGLDRRRHVVEDRRAVVGEHEIAELDLAADGADPAEAGRSTWTRLGDRSAVRFCRSRRDRRLRLQHLEHPLPRRHAALQHVRHPAERDHRPARASSGRR